jgi:alpha-methylacyl-CoA racemase
VKSAEPPLLGGLRVVDLSAMGPGPRCMRLLADYGAEVIKVLRPAPPGDRLRGSPRAAYGWYRDVERIVIDIKTDEGHSLVHRLAAVSDVVIESFRPGVARRLGIGAEDMMARNDKLIYCAISGYGQDGPYAGWPGHDLNWLGMGGYLALQGRTADGLPAMPGAVVADSLGGMCAANAVLAALVRRAERGTGAYLDIAVLEAVLRLTYVSIDQYLGTGERQEHDAGTLNGGAPYYGIYRTADDRFVTVAAIEPKFFANLCAALGVAALAGDQHRQDRYPALRAALATRFATRTRDEWVGELGPRDTCVAPVYEIDEIAADPHMAARGMVWEAEHDELGKVSQVTPALTAGSRSQRNPLLRDLGVTNPEGALARIGIDRAGVKALRAAGVVN